MSDAPGLSLRTTEVAVDYQRTLIERRFARAHERIDRLQAELREARVELRDAQAALVELGSCATPWNVCSGPEPSSRLHADYGEPDAPREDGQSALVGVPPRAVQTDLDRPSCPPPAAAASRTG